MSTDLDEYPEFTLTCKTFGGRGTVRWTRNSGYASGTKTTQLVSRVSMEYNYTLTVRWRLGGDYRCTLSVDDGDDQWRSLNVRGKCDNMGVLHPKV